MLMMKKVIGWFLASIGVLTILVIGVASWRLSTFMTSFSVLKEHEPLGKKSILALNLGSDPMEDYHFRHQFWSHISTSRPQSLLEILDAIREAKRDPHIGGIFVSLEGHNLSLSQAAEIRQELKRFKQSNKPVHIFAYAFSEASNGTIPYYLASMGDDIAMQPTGIVSVNGFSLESPFFKNLLDNYQITIQSDRREKYKGVIEPFTQTAYSSEVRENLNSVLVSLFDHVKEKIAEGRKMEKAAVLELVKESPWLDYQALQKKYISELAYKDEAKDQIKKKAYPNDRLEDVKFVSVRSYLDQSKHAETSEKIGVVVLSGDIVSPGGDTTAQEPFSPEGIEKALRKAWKKKQVKAVVLRVNSPGGSVSGAEAIWHAVKKTVDSGIPVVVSMGDLAASAGYYLVAPADKIYALPTTLTGSIGVAFGKPNIRKTAESFGITLDQVDVGSNADMWSVTHDFSPEIWEKMKNEVDHIYHVFKGKVAQGRKMNDADVQAVAQGQVWTGLQAKEHRLVDQIGGFFDAVEEARRLGKVQTTDPDLIVLNESTATFSMLFDLLSTEVVEKIRLQLLAKLPQVRLEARTAIEKIG